ncbi:MAG TPA: RNA polymerase subunit sigma-24 [Anaerolineaceae bacterium]|jgi:RNA polymerase sigma-70 factor (ECF subfamily)|nr:MAG: RNA polymerase sigma factor [Anaerolineaceae bacterium 46_22]HAF47668.1 RNA polymerase subunit sigma-24 [Anaerolineaceae bacterium]
MNENSKTSETFELEALQKRDRAAFAQVLDQNSDRIYRLALKMLGNVQDAEDILQETFIKAFKNIDQFEGRSKISTWLYRIAVNESLMLLRKRKGNPIQLDAPLETDDGDLIPRQIVDWCCLPEKELMNTETRDHIREAVKTLSDANRAAFILRDVEGLSTQETAEALDISESAVKVRLMRARMQLREELTAFFAGKMIKETL